MSAGCRSRRCRSPGNRFEDLVGEHAHEVDDVTVGVAHQTQEHEVSQHIERIADTTSIVRPPWSCRGLLSDSDNIVLRVHPITQRVKHDEVSPGQRDSPPPEKQDWSAATIGSITA